MMFFLLFTALELSLSLQKYAKRHIKQKNTAKKRCLSIICHIFAETNNNM